MRPTPPFINVRAHLARLMRTDTSMTAGHVVPRADRNFGGSDWVWVRVGAWRSRPNIKSERFIDSDGRKPNFPPFWSAPETAIHFIIVFLVHIWRSGRRHWKQRKVQNFSRGLDCLRESVSFCHQISLAGDNDRPWRGPEGGEQSRHARFQFVESTFSMVWLGAAED